ncbi:MAG TPA: FHA domain-containing protein [Streptosporangiaceae bacterium]|nr:FHA domain-containing protein [Streptosporangiaceae bacterium]
MTGATPQGRGEQTQPMAIPPWPEVAGGWPSGRAERGPYADADTIDELDAVAAWQTGSAPPGAEADQGPSGAGSGSAVAAPDAGADWPDAARRPGGPLLAWLWGEQGQAGEYLLASNSVTVGRDPGSDVVLTDATVSGKHAKIEYCEGQWWLQTADSAGPTWVNGQPVEPGRRLPVTDGDRLRFGFHTQFRLLVPSAR